MPLSENYRRHLRKICQLLKQKEGEGEKSLPPDIANNREKLLPLCRKLAADDANIAGAGLGWFGGAGKGFGTGWLSRLALAGVLVGGGWLAYRRFLSSSSTSSPSYGAGFGSDRIAQADAIRKARLEKLAGGMGGGGGGVRDLETPSNYQKND